MEKVEEREKESRKEEKNEKTPCKRENTHMPLSHERRL